MMRNPSKSSLVSIYWMGGGGGKLMSYRAIQQQSLQLVR